MLVPTGVPTRHQMLCKGFLCPVRFLVLPSALEERCIVIPILLMGSQGLELSFQFFFFFEVSLLYNLILVSGI